MRLRAVMVAAAVAAAVLGCRRTEQTAPLNVLLITLDTTRADHLGSYGARNGATPSLDALAARGVRFELAQSVAPLTLPAHATMLTGLLPQRHQLRVNGGGVLGDGVETLAMHFQRKGFRTGAFVGAFVLDRRFGLSRGFDVYDDAVARDPEGGDVSLEAERSAESVADAALAWLRADPDRPFFAWVHFYDAHAPYAAPKPFAERFAASPYDGELAYVDAQVARIVDALEKSGVRGRTLIAVAGDHGEGLGDHGEATHGLLLYESTLRVPLIIEAPALKPHTVRAPVSLADLTPTIAALAGDRFDAATDGRDLSVDLIGQRQPETRDLYAETHYPRAFGWSDLVAVRRGAKKLISGAHDELFDLASDPGETRNVMSDDRRVYRELAAGVLSMRREEAPAPAIDEETRAKLASLGYVAPSGAKAAGPRPDPRSKIEEFSRFEKAAERLRANDAAAAIGALVPLVQADRGNRVFRSMLARAYERRGDRAYALQLYKESVAIAPADADAWYELAAALQDGGVADEARVAIGEALRLDPRRAEGHNMIGVSLASVDDHVAAADAFRRALSIDPRNARASNNLGNSLRAMNRPSEALDAYRRAAELSPRNPDPLNGIGVVLVMMNRASEALPYFDRALALAPEYHEARLNRAVAVATLGDKRTAATQLRELLSMLPRGREFDPQRKAATALLAQLSS
ncbi:MAG: sulfatase-like hydrolase/transferase [Thermoanaerobaculia bacterium]|nr:sulfatase-like hydrolase/transferase [Thermoanaerobaculia bacterium]